MHRPAARLSTPLVGRRETADESACRVAVRYSGPIDRDSCYSCPGRRPANGKRHRFPVDAVLLFIGLALMCAAMLFVKWRLANLTKAWLSYLLFPAVLCIAVRSGIKGAVPGDPLDHSVFIDRQRLWLRPVPRPRSNAWLLARADLSRGFSPDQPGRRDP